MCIRDRNGFGIYKDAEKRDFIRKLAKERGIVILTDSDNAGRQIRAYITSFVPSNQIRHAYIPDIYGKEKRKAAPSKEGKLGVEGISSEILLEILKEAGASVEGSTTDFQPVSYTHLVPRLHGCCGICHGVVAVAHGELCKENLIARDIALFHIVELF